MARLYRVIDNVYISDATSAADAELRAAEGITHMLAVAAYCTQFPPKACTSRLVTASVECADFARCGW